MVTDEDGAKSSPLMRKSSRASNKSGSAKSEGSHRNKNQRDADLMGALPEDDGPVQSISRVGSVLDIDTFGDDTGFGLSKRASFFGGGDIFGAAPPSSQQSRTASFRLAQSSMRTVSMARLDPKGVLAPVRERQVSLKLDTDGDRGSIQAKMLSAAGERMQRNRGSSIDSSVFGAGRRADAPTPHCVHARAPSFTFS